MNTAQKTARFRWQCPDLGKNTDHNDLPVGNAIKGWEARQRPPGALMSGQYCQLEPFDIDRHTEGLFNSFSLDTDERNWTYLAYGPFDREEEFRQWCNTYCLVFDN